MHICIFIIGSAISCLRQKHLALNWNFWGSAPHAAESPPYPQYVYCLRRSYDANVSDWFLKLLGNEEPSELQGHPSLITAPDRSGWFVISLLAERQSDLLLFFPVVLRSNSGSSPLLTGFRDHIQTHHTRRSPLEECPVGRRTLYMTTHNNQQTSLPSARFEPTITASERS
jgi:hypothetical protein